MSTETLTTRTTRSALRFLTGLVVSVAAACSGNTQQAGSINSAATQYELKVQVVGTAAGSVAWTDGGGSHSCSGVCFAALPFGQVVTLTATPVSGAQFAGWGGSCSGTGTSCTVTIVGNTKALGAFSASANPPLVVNVVGKGSVSSAPAGITCTNAGETTCSSEFALSSTVTLTATAASGQTFNGWSGSGCSGTGTCSVTMAGAQTVSALFTGEKLRLDVGLSGSGLGSVTSSPGTIACGTAGGVCGDAFDPATLVTLTATAAGGSVFTGWSGAGCSGFGTCVVTLDESKSVGARFSTVGSGAVSADRSSVEVVPATSIADGSTLSTIYVTVRDANGNPLAGKTVVLSVTGAGNTVGTPAATDQAGVAFASIVSTTAGTKTVSASIGAVALSQTSQVVFSGAPGRVTGRVIFITGKNPYTLTPIVGATVTVDGQTASATTLDGTTTACDGSTPAAGSFVVCNVTPGAINVTATPPATWAASQTNPSLLPATPAGVLATDTREFTYLIPGGTAAIESNLPAPRVGGANAYDIAMSSAPPTTATYVGVSTCYGCHSGPAGAFINTAHYRSLTDVYPSKTQPATNKWTVSYYPGNLAARILNPTISTPRYVTDSSTTYGPYTYLWPEDSHDIVNPSVKATNPNYNPNDPSVYNGTYTDGIVSVYLCNKGTRTTPEYLMKFGGSSTSCSDGSIFDASTNPNPAVPMVHIATIYGGEGDRIYKNATNPSAGLYQRPNVGVFKQRYLALLSEVKAASLWPTPAAGSPGTAVPGYLTAADRDRDSFTLPVQLLQSGDKVNGAYKLNGYHPTEAKFPGESWTQRSRTFSHACAGCHNVGLQVETEVENVALQIPRDDGSTTMRNLAVTSYNYIDQNMTCEHCHGPGSAHAAANGGTGGRGTGILYPVILKAKQEVQMCGKCHSYDDGTAGKIQEVGGTFSAQSYGFEYPWSSENKAAGYGYQGNYNASMDLESFFDNWEETKVDDEAIWDPSQTDGVLYGQAHRQQYLMFEEAAHTTNPYEKIACSDCHSGHGLGMRANSPGLMSKDASTNYSMAVPTVFPELGDPASPSYDAVAAANGPVSVYKNNVLCLSCHSGFTFPNVTHDDVAALNIGYHGSATLSSPTGATISPNFVFESSASIACSSGTPQWTAINNGSAVCQTKVLTCTGNVASPGLVGTLLPGGAACKYNGDCQSYSCDTTITDTGPYVAPGTGTNYKGTNQYGYCKPVTAACTVTATPVLNYTGTTFSTALAHATSDVVAHMKQKAGMNNNNAYDPTNDALPVGRCVTCHMPKVAKSGGYTTTTDAFGNKALLEGDQASHTFKIIWPNESKALSRGGPTFQSAYYAQSTGGTTGTKYDAFGYMPNSCSKCHEGARKASLYCPDTATIYPAGFPFSDQTQVPFAPGGGYDYANNPILKNCVTSTNAN
jgi:hypothetical protein